MFAHIVVVGIQILTKEKKTLQRIFCFLDFLSTYDDGIGGSSSSLLSILRNNVGLFRCA